jgi:hypothetical protein
LALKPFSAPHFGFGQSCFCPATVIAFATRLRRALPKCGQATFDSLRENSVTVRHPNMLLKKPLFRLTMFNSFTMLVPPAQDDQVFRRHAMVF